MYELCSTCLCKDRRLVPLKSLEDNIISSVSWMNLNFEDGQQVCWECRALLTRFLGFRQQALRARELITLLVAAKPPTCLPILSNLSTSIKTTYDETIIYDDNIKEELRPDGSTLCEIKEEIIINDEIDSKNTRKVKEDFNDEVASNDEQIFEDESTIIVKMEEIIDDLRNNIDRNISPKPSTFVSSEPSPELLPKTGYNKNQVSKDEEKFVVRKMAEEEMEKAREMTRNTNRYIKAPYKCEKCITGYYSEKQYNCHNLKQHSEMGRTRQEGRKKGRHSEEAMKKAIALVQGGMSIRQASKECQLCYPTVRNYVKKINENAGQTIRLTPNYEVNRVFTSEEEDDLVKYIEHYAELFYGLTAKGCRRIAYQMVKVNNHKTPKSWLDTETAGAEWLRAFRKRHPQISLRKPEVCGVASSDLNKHNIESFFRNLKSAMERHPSFADGTRLYNLDETSNTTVQRPGNVSAKVISERGTLFTTCLIVSAIGQAIPPAMVFYGKNFQAHMLDGAPPGTLGLAAPTGWNADTFAAVMRHFIKHISASKENPALLLMDNDECHISIEALNLAKSSGVTVLTLPHTMEKLQPLDELRKYYNAAVDSRLLKNPGQSLTLSDIAECVSSAYLKTMTPVNIVNAFKKCGIFPFDGGCFTEADFLPSTVTYRLPPSTAEEDPEQSKNITTIFDDSQSSSLLLNSSNQNLTAPLIEDLDLLPPIHKVNIIKQTPPHLLESPNIPDPLGLWQNSEHTPSTSKKYSLIDFLPPIKTEPLTMKRRRVEKSMIATDTEEEVIVEKKKKENKKQVEAKQYLLIGDNTRKESNKDKRKTRDIGNSDTSDEEEFIASASSSGGEEFLSENDDGNLGRHGKGK